MNPDDRIDAALGAIARTEASREFAARVSARIAAGDDGRAVWWPRLAAASAIAALVLSIVWVSRDTAAPPPMAAAVPLPAPGTSPPVTVEPVTEVTSRAPVVPRRVRTPRPAESDHDAALAALPLPDAISLSSVTPDALVVVDHVIAPLAPIAPLSVHEMLGDFTQGEL